MGMIVTHPGIADAAYGQIFGDEMSDRVIDADATGMGRLEDPLPALAVAVKQIDRQRARPLIDVVKRLFQRAIGERWAISVRKSLPASHACPV